MGLGIFGYFEYREADDHEWQADSKLPTMPNSGRLWYPLVGVRSGATSSTSFDVEPIAENRGIPDDVSETVAEDYEQQKRVWNPLMDEYTRDTFGHSFLYPDEIPEEKRIDELDQLYELAEEYGDDNVRMVVWFNV